MASTKVTSIFDYQPKPTKLVRRSNKFPKAFMLNGCREHYFFNEPKFIDGKVHIEYVFYDYKWRQDTSYFTVEKYNEIMGKVKELKCPCKTAP
jgi:hypothetical protein